MSQFDEGQLPASNDHDQESKQRIGSGPIGEPLLELKQDVGQLKGEFHRFRGELDRLRGEFNQFSQDVRDDIGLLAQRIPGKSFWMRPTWWFLHLLDAPLVSSPVEIIFAHSIE